MDELNISRALPGVFQFIVSPISARRAMDSAIGGTGEAGRRWRAYNDSPVCSSLAAAGWWKVEILRRAFDCHLIWVWIPVSL
jgi:hypothetical protein